MVIIPKGFDSKRSLSQKAIIQKFEMLKHSLVE